MLCTLWLSHSQWPSQQISEYSSMRLSILETSWRIFGITWHHPDLSAPLQHRFGSLRTYGFPKAKITLESEEICECDRHTVHKTGQRRLTADWLAPRESNYSRMCNKVSSDWLPSYIKANESVLEIFKIVGYFPDSPRKLHCILSTNNGNVLCLTLTILIYAHS